MSSTFSTLIDANIRIPFMQKLLKWKYSMEENSNSQSRVSCVFSIECSKIDLWLAECDRLSAGYGFVLCVRIDLTDSFVDCHKRSTSTLTYTDGVMWTAEGIEAKLPIGIREWRRKTTTTTISYDLFGKNGLGFGCVILELIKCLLLSNRFSAFTANCLTIQNYNLLCYAHDVLHRSYKLNNIFQNYNRYEP